MSPSDNLVLPADPPEDISLSEESLELTEGDQLEPVLCSGSGSPDISFYWTLREEVVAEGDLLTFQQPVDRAQAGNYLCHGANRHGEQVASLSLAVLYKPQCQFSLSVSNNNENVYIIIRFTDLHI